MAKRSTRQAPSGLRCSHREAKLTLASYPPCQDSGVFHDVFLAVDGRARLGLIVTTTQLSYTKEVVFVFLSVVISLPNCRDTTIELSRLLLLQNLLDPSLAFDVLCFPCVTSAVACYVFRQPAAGSFINHRPKGSLAIIGKLRSATTSSHRRTRTHTHGTFKLGLK